MTKKTTSKDDGAEKEVIRDDIHVFAGGITWVDCAYDERLGEVLRPLVGEKSRINEDDDIANRGDRHPLDGAVRWLNSRLSQEISVRELLILAADRRVAIATWSEDAQCWLYLDQLDLHRFERNSEHQTDTLFQHKTAKSFYNDEPLQLIGGGGERIAIDDLVIFERDLFVAYEYLLSKEEKYAVITSGRYTLRQAAEALSEKAGERQEAILRKFVKAVENEDLATYEPRKSARYDYSDGRRVRDFYEEAFWDDLNEWLKNNEPRISFRFPAPSVDDQPFVAETPQNVQVCDQTKRSCKLRDQENVVLATIKELGYDPASLPQTLKGRKGVKAAVRDHLVRHHLFAGRKVFDKAWQRLRDDGQITETA